MTLVVSLLQVYRRQQKLDGIGLFAIGFEIFKDGYCGSVRNRKDVMSVFTKCTSDYTGYYISTPVMRCTNYALFTRHYRHSSCCVNT
ncbi:hypothetical protein MAR_023255 [Mya arenaria]|uniref:Uncharacterized protein n=1 Tax=Mya arenaria TaxID=6604 RepID=A0ABY7DQ87_MYAAR|nr:hypothetical protein MAR_023255 [Mya arenaria]